MQVGSTATITSSVYDPDGETGDYTMIISWDYHYMKLRIADTSRALLTSYIINATTIICTAPYNIMRQSLDILVAGTFIGDANITLIIIDTTALSSFIHV
jgi:hypothetical protein